MFETDENATEELSFNVEQPTDGVAPEVEVKPEAESQPQAEAESKQSQDLEFNKADEDSNSGDDTKKNPAEEAFKRRERQRLEAERIAELKKQDDEAKAKAEKDKRENDMYAYYQKQKLGPMPDVNDDKYLKDDGYIDTGKFSEDLLAYNSQLPQSTDNQEYQAKKPEELQHQAKLHVIKHDDKEAKEVIPNYNNVISSSDNFLGSLIEGTSADTFNDAIADVVQMHDGMGLNYAKIKASLSVKGAQERFLQAIKDNNLTSPYDKAKFFQGLQSDYFDKPLKKRSGNSTTPLPNVKTNGGSTTNSGIENYGSFS